METTNIISLIRAHGWQAVLIAFAALILIEVFKPLIRKSITNEQGRHAFYSIVDALLIGLGTYVLLAVTAQSWAVSLEVFGYVAGASYTVLKLVYPLYSNLGLQKLLLTIFKAVFKNRKALVEEVKKQEATIEPEKTEEPKTKKVVEL